MEVKNKNNLQELNVKYVYDRKTIFLGITVKAIPEIYYIDKMYEIQICMVDLLE